jgi:putative transposase
MLGLPFDPQGDVDRWEGNRPHWAQAGAIAFITMRTHDSIPKDVLARWDFEKLQWLWRHGIECAKWWKGLEFANPTLRAEFAKEFHRTREMYLDTCQGECVLRRPELAQIVASTLRHFDGVRYELGDFVVMPNHVHLLAVFSDNTTMKAQCTSWMKYTATAINRLLNRRGPFWQQEVFDHLVRHAEQYDAIRRYIATNPEKAKLPAGEYIYYRRPD